MKTNYIKLLSLLLGVGGLIASCSDSVDVGSVSEKSFETPAKTMVFLTDKYGNMKRRLCCVQQRCYDRYVC